MKLATSRDEYKALALRMGGMLCGAMVLLVDKYLTISLAWRLVLLSGYLLPGVLIPLLRPKQTLRGIREFRDETRLVVATTLLYII